MTLEVRTLTGPEVPRVWTIDRREHIAGIYRLRDGQLVLEPHDFEVPGWKPGQEEETTPRLLALVARGGSASAFYDGDTLVAAAFVDVEPAGSSRDLIKFDWLHVSRDYRGRGLGGLLLERAKAFARQRGAGGLYISSAPTENTVNFYIAHGAKLAAEPDPELFAFEPEDIHLEWRP